MGNVQRFTPPILAAFIPMKKNLKRAFRAFFFILRRLNGLSKDGTARIRKQNSAKGRGLGKESKCKGMEKGGHSNPVFKLSNPDQTQTCSVRYTGSSKKLEKKDRIQKWQEKKQIKPGLEGGQSSRLFPSTQMLKSLVSPLRK